MEAKRKQRKGPPKGYGATRNAPHVYAVRITDAELAELEHLAASHYKGKAHFKLRVFAEGLSAMRRYAKRQGKLLTFTEQAEGLETAQD